MIVGDVLRAALYLTIPLDLSIHFANPLTWVYVVQFLASCVSLFWTPAKDASVPNLVPPDRLEEANQYSLFTTFGTAPIAGIVFSLLSLVSRALEGLSHYFTTNPVNLALYFNAVTFVVSALTIYALREIPKRQFSSHISAPAVARTIWEGWRFIGRTPVVRGPGHRHGRGVRGRRRGGRAGPAVHHAHPARRQRGLGRRVRRDLRGPGRRDVPRPAHPQRVQPAAAVRAEHRQRGDPARAHRADPEPGRHRSAGRPAGRLRRRGLRDRLHDRRARGGRRHPGPHVRVPQFRHPGHPVHA